ncbi:protein-glutamate methylesterase/protein-glutamine glutaminase [Neobacillus ginsengisoli]|uniref:Protein-glutamate methylesterase/protein-glutamine glutaminase n=1 Tax=Neobacillus ginsengisoli TaxID=904295 RepID=A0ABT9XXD0_9BACI|nr:chemotaxis response regulator protein-glutamate methylesterase [Neobacillus ginsengisoli]MDQ0199589.1 two-component system chemotaxis response regulator CheB [Neobacillus ginsengisoli]
MKQYGVLVVDDSAFMRRAISLILENDPQLYVVGIARNGIEAVEKVQRLQPDLVTMDVEMPEMNGLRALEEIMKLSPVPVVMLSSHTREGAEESFQSLQYGAVDFFLKENLIRNQVSSDQTQEFLHRLKSSVEAKIPCTYPVEYTPEKKISCNYSHADLIFIGCSTGGPSALQAILPRFPMDLPLPIVVAQHMPPGFTKPLAERFDTLCQLKVKEAQNGQKVKAGTIYIAPSGYQTTFEKDQEGDVIFKVDIDNSAQALYRPSIDISLHSAAPIFTDRLLSVILTGMGVDGMQGCGSVKKYRGSVLVEAEKSCIVYGMPKAVMEAGYADGQFELSQMYQKIMSFI